MRQRPSMQSQLPRADAVARCGMSVRSRQPRLPSSGSSASSHASILGCTSASKPARPAMGSTASLLRSAMPEVVAPSLIPRRPGEHVKTNRRDAASLARLLRAGELKGIWVPDAVHEAVRDLVRAREAAGEDLRKKRQQLQSFLLRHGRTFTGRKAWSPAHSRWLAAQRFEHPAQQIVFQDQVDVIADASKRLERLDAQLAELVPTWSMAPVVAAYQALRGVSFVVAVTFVSEVGDVRRFDNPRQLMAFLGLVPSERSTGESVRRGGLTLAGNRRARRVLVEGAWSYRHPARVTETILVRLEGLPKEVREIAWKAQTRLCARYRRMRAAGKKAPIVIAAIAREMAAFLWAIGRQVEPVR